MTRLIDTACTWIAGAFMAVMLIGVILFGLLGALIALPAHLCCSERESPGPRGEWFVYVVAGVLTLVVSHYWPGVWGA